MATAHQVRSSSLFSPQLITGVYIPSVILIVVVGVLKIEYLPFAIVASGLLGAYRIYGNGMYLSIVPTQTVTQLTITIVAQKALKPDEFQNFPLQEKTVLSHNVAM